MDLSAALRTTGAVRRFTDEAVERATVAAVLDDARFAPSGGNRQPWRVAVVEDRLLRRQMAALMQPVWDEYVAAAASGQTPFNAVAFNPPDMTVGRRARTSCSSASSRSRLCSSSPPTSKDRG